MILFIKYIKIAIKLRSKIGEKFLVRLSYLKSNVKRGY